MFCQENDALLWEIRECRMILLKCCEVSAGIFTGLALSFDLVFNVKMEWPIHPSTALRLAARARFVG